MKKKLTLTVEALEVDTFATGPAAASVGTVRGHDTVQPFPENDIAQPVDISYDTMCAKTVCFTCDKMCPSGASACYTGQAPQCCV